MGTRFLISWFTLVAVTAAHGRWCRPEPVQRCSLDGNRREPLYQVDLAADGRVLASFCSLACARAWPDVPSGSYWQVRDEVTGRTLDATLAHFVASRIVTVPAHAERIHVFAHWADAEAHVERHDGRPLPNPLDSRTLDQRPAEPGVILETPPTDH